MPPVGRSRSAHAAVPRAPSHALAVVSVLLALLGGFGPPGRAQDAGSTPAAEIPTVEGTRDATVPLRRKDAGRGAQAPVAPTTMPPALLGTLSPWQATADRSAIRIGSEFGA